MFQVLKLSKQINSSKTSPLRYGLSHRLSFYRACEHASLGPRGGKWASIAAGARLPLETQGAPSRWCQPRCPLLICSLKSSVSLFPMGEGCCERGQGWKPYSRLPFWLFIGSWNEERVSFLSDFEKNRVVINSNIFFNETQPVIPVIFWPSSLVLASLTRGIIMVIHHCSARPII